ncbi:MAG TPA: dynamin family protein [Solirubrobacteraceae bacterium]|nr:dynamin family protein [Solirubrobacteraceae bacterium]
MLEQTAKPSLPEFPPDLPDSAGLRSTLGELIAFSDTLGLRGLLRDLRAARERLVGDRLNLVVLGEFKRGKSTLINALLERDVLPTGVLPLTSVVTILAAGDRERLLVSYSDGSEQELPLDELPTYVTEAGNPENWLGVEVVRVELANELLVKGIDLVDTPGVGSIHQHNTSTAREFLAQVDAAVFVLDAGQPFTAAERDLVRELAQRVPRVLLVLNRIDQLIGEDRQAALEFIEQAASDLSGCEPEAVFAVSAREGEGMAALRRRLSWLASEERLGTLARSVAGVAAAAAAEIMASARLEIRARELPLRELQQRAGIFQDQITELRSAGEEAATLLDQGARRALVEHLDRPLECWAAAESERLRLALRDHAGKLDRCSAGELAAELLDWIEACIRNEFAELVGEFEPSLAAELETLQDGYAARIGRILDDVQTLAVDVFDTDRAGLLPRAGLCEQSRFSFKLHDSEQALDMIVGRLRTLVPGRLGRHLLLADAEQRLVEMADRHAGRLRSELHERVVESIRSYRKDLAASVERAIAAITQALERAENQHTQDHASIRARATELAAIAERCELIAELEAAAEPGR